MKARGGTVIPMTHIDSSHDMAVLHTSGATIAEASR